MNTVKGLILDIFFFFRYFHGQTSSPWDHFFKNCIRKWAALEIPIQFISPFSFLKIQKTIFSNFYWNYNQRKWNNKVDRLNRWLFAKNPFFWFQIPKWIIDKLFGFYQFKLCLIYCRLYITAIHWKLSVQYWRKLDEIFSRFIVTSSSWIMAYFNFSPLNFPD